MSVSLQGGISKRYSGGHQRIYIRIGIGIHIHIHTHTHKNDSRKDCLLNVTGLRLVIAICKKSVYSTKRKRKHVSMWVKNEKYSRSHRTPTVLQRCGNNVFQDALQKLS